MTDVLLDQLKKCLDQYGIESQIRDDRAEGMYISIGDNRWRRKRAQFWVNHKTGAVNFWIGVDMGKIYSLASYSKYRVEYKTEKYGEIHLVFPYLYPAMEFIRMIGEV